MGSVGAEGYTPLCVFVCTACHMLVRAIFSCFGFLACKPCICQKPPAQYRHPPAFTEFVEVFGKSVFGGLNNLSGSVVQPAPAKLAVESLMACLPALVKPGDCPLFSLSPISVNL